jgi:hypothetical protein
MSTIIYVDVLAIIGVGILVMGGRWMQRLVISNLFGLGFTAVAWMAVILIYESETWKAWQYGGLPDGFPWLLGSGLLTLVDLGNRDLFVRPKHERQADEARGPWSSLWGHWLTSHRGASLLVLPAWVLGALLAGIFAVLCFLDFLWMDHYLPTAY